MIVWFGTRAAGKVDQRDGQYAVTRFAHVYFLPLIPTGSIWVTQEGVGHDIKLSWKSVIAGYARTWSLVLGALGILWGGPAFIAAIGAVAVGALSLAWRDVQGDSAKRKSDLNLLGFGTRCEPKLLTDGIAETLRKECDERWALLANGQSPGDVARFGTDDIDRASAAYAVLRLHALTMPRDKAAEAEADAKRIADGVRDKLQISDGGPYRSAVIDAHLVPEDPNPSK